MTDIWKPQPGRQTEALTIKCKELLYGGARYGGKTEIGLAWLLKPFKQLADDPEALEQYTALIIRRNLKDLKRWLRRAGHFYRSLGVKVIGGNAPELRFPNGVLFYCGHLKDENSYLQYMGDEIPRILFEELNQLSSEDSYIQVLGSNRSGIPGLDARIMANTNPGGPGHVWIRDRWNIKGKPPYKTIRINAPGGERVFVPAKAEDNPIGMEKDPGYIKYLDDLPDKLRDSWRHGDWDSFAGQYFEDLSEDRHGIESFQIPDHWDLWGGLDYGETNPTSFGLYTYNTISNKKIRIWQYYEKEKSANEYASDIVTQLLDLKITNGRMPKITYADPSMWTRRRVSIDESGMRQTFVVAPEKGFNDAGLYLVPANNDRIAGWRNLKNHLKVDSDCGFAYFEDYCPKYFRHMTSVIHDTKNVEDVLKCSIDHMADETRYGMMAEESPVKISDFYDNVDERHDEEGVDYSPEEEVAPW